MKSRRRFGILLRKRALRDPQTESVVFIAFDLPLNASDCAEVAGYRTLE